VSAIEPHDAAERILQEALSWLGHEYPNRVFYVERDIVYTVQQRVNDLIAGHEAALTAYNDYPVLPGPRRGFSADLALLDPARDIAVAVEFKYEPCHRRSDILKSKLPVTDWSEIVKDTSRIRQFVDSGRASVGYAVVIDEGGYLLRRDLSIYADRQEWSGHWGHDHPLDALIFRYPHPEDAAP
jgi:hypothetical protein